MTYLTDGMRLYEVVAERVTRNYGLLGGVLRRTVIRDCVSEETATVDDLQLMALAEVSA